MCVLSSVDNVCISELTLPSEWWIAGQTESVEVLYSVYGIDQNLQCSSSGGAASSSSSTERIKSFVSTVTLTHG